MKDRSIFIAVALESIELIEPYIDGYDLQQALELLMGNYPDTQ